MNRLTLAVISIALAVIMASAGFIGGYGYATYGPNSVRSALPVFEKEEGIGERVDEVREMMANDGLVPPSETSATIGAINGLLESTGDKYGMYFDAKHYEYFNEESMGEFGGIGVTIGEKEGTAYVVEVIEDTPAEAAGIKTGDLFVKIDKVRRDKWTTDEVVKRVRGEEGTTVKIVMYRPGKNGEGKEITFEVERAKIRYPNVKSEIKSGDVGYIRLYQFNEKSTGDIANEIAELEKKGAKSFVLDLRDNPGGLLDQAVGVSSLFVEDGVIVSVEERKREPVEYRATGNVVTDRPVVVLVNENSASASEIVAGALQDYGRATLIGVKTFGKGSVQTIHETSFGGAVKYTTAHYLTPKKRAIDGKGLEPDIKVAMDLEKQMDEKSDAQLKRAIEYAKTGK